MRFSCERAGVPCPDLREIVKPYEGREVQLRVEVLPRGELLSRGDVKVTSTDLPRWHGSFLWDKVWKLKVVTGQRREPEVKSLDTDFQTRERKEAKQEGFDEILLVSPKGVVLEGGITNVFFVEGDHLVTPASGVLPGIARELVLNVARELGIRVVSREVLANELPKFDFIFLTNSIVGMVPVVGIAPSGQVVSVVQRIADGCTEFIKRRCAQAA